VDAFRSFGGKALGWLALLLTITGLCGVRETYAVDLKSASAQLAERSFALLDRLSKQGGDNPNPLIGPIASFAGDADSLRVSLTRSDSRLASSNIAALQADCSVIDQALKQHPSAIAPGDWRSLRQQVDQLAHETPPCGPGCGPPRLAASDAGPGSALDTSDARYGPRIVIISSESDGDSIRLKGYFEGIALRSAGIYQGSDRLRAFNVGRVSGRERVEFDLRLEDPSADTTLQVADAAGRTAQAAVLDSRLQPPHAPDAGVLPATVPPEVATETSEPLPKSGDDSGTEEIPSHGPILPSPSKRHTLGSKLGDVRINIFNVTRTGNLPPTYQVDGQIVGRGITRAGIYLDGRQLQRIAITDSARYTNFHERIIVQGGSATIRAYTIGNLFAEQSVDLSDAADGSELSDDGYDAFATMAPSSVSGIAIQITSIRPVTANLFIVSGSISGSGIVSAGLYQNGELAQNINLGTGLTGALGALISGSRSINFNARFNPYSGPASVRAFDRAGAYTEQPVIIAGVPRYNTTWPNSPYTGAGRFPFGRGLSPSSSGNAFGSTYPLW
jgi:hypothetical protein